jgi:hypothetical protein
MKTDQSNNQVRKSTYAMLVRSEEKERSLFETIAYGLFILSTVAAIWQFAQQPVNIPADAPRHTASTTQAAVVSNS